MSHKYRNYNKYNPNWDIAIWIAVLIILFLYKVIKIYNDNPIYFWLWVIALLICVCIIILLLKKKRDRKYMKIQTLEQMKNMDWREFEKFIAFVFQKKWFKAKERKWRNDWGIDVDATKNGEKYGIQCKKWKEYKIWVVELRAFVWAIDWEWRNVKWIYITTSKLTIEAEKYLQKVEDRVELWDASNLEEYIKEYTTWIKFPVEENNTQENHNTKKITCEKCWWEMIIKEAQKWNYKWKKFYWCSNFPKCKNIINIK
jgi:restriction system protein